MFCITYKKKTGSNSTSPQPTTGGNPLGTSPREQKTNEYTIVNTASTMRVLNVVRHWLTKHPLVKTPFLYVFLLNIRHLLGLSSGSQIERSE